jgi:acetylglutamate/LysW-gamma-L-alpha-aminoadipate kinase
MLVVKVGGSQGINYDAVCADVAALVRGGTRLVLVHGGSHETNVISERLGKPPRMLTSVSGFTSRYTDAETLDIFAMVYCGKVQKRLVERLQRLGCNALGLSGVDGRLLEGSRKAAITVVEGGKKRVVRDDFTGRVEQVNAGLLTSLLDTGYTPVVAPLAISFDGEAINVDGDRAAAAIAAALGAERLVILSNVPGLLRRYPDEATLIPRLARVGLAEALDFAEGRMKKKVLGAAEAFAGGVRQVIFADGRVEGPIRAALAGRGTVIE